MPLQVELCGGCELVFGGKGFISLTNDEVQLLPDSCVSSKQMNLQEPVQKITVGHLIAWLTQERLEAKRDLFAVPHVEDSKTTSKVHSYPYTVRPGILVLLDDVDWEIVGGLDAEISQGVGKVTFISTLHGG